MPDRAIFCCLDDWTEMCLIRVEFLEPQSTCLNCFLYLFRLPYSVHCRVRDGGAGEGVNSIPLFDG